MYTGYRVRGVHMSRRLGVCVARYSNTLAVKKSVAPRLSACLPACLQASGVRPGIKGLHISPNRHCTSTVELQHDYFAGASSSTGWRLPETARLIFPRAFPMSVALVCHFIVVVPGLQSIKVWDALHISCKTS
jgi:hypothetical protein